MESDRLSSISNNLATMSLDLRGFIRETNLLFCDIMGYSSEELLGKHHEVLCAQKYVESTEHREFWERLQSGESYSDDCLRFKKNGDEIWLRAIYIPVRDATGKIIEIFTMAYEVTAQLITEVDYRSQLLAINKSLARIEFDLDGVVLTANDNFLSTTGYSLSDIVGKHHRIFCPSDCVESDAYQHFWQNLKAEISFQGDFLRKTKGGQDLWLRASYSPVYDIQGKLVKIVKFAWDITEEQNTKLKVVDALTTTAATLSQDSILLTQSAHHLKQNAEVAQRKLYEFRDIIQVTTDSIETVAHAMTAMDACIAHISENTAGAAGLSLDALSETCRSSKDVSSLKHKVLSIAEVVRSIDKIAANTNLLALNATIEASRAGEAGRGFSVVAQEVKNLSCQTQQATKNIDSTARAIEEKTEVVSKRIASILEVVELLNQIATSIANAVQEQSATTEEVTNSITTIFDMTKRSHQKLTQTASLADESLTIVRTLEATSGKCNQLSLELQQFISTVNEF